MTAAIPLHPAVTVKDGESVIPNSEYMVSYTNNTNVGTATVTVKDRDGGNYMLMEKNASFEIIKADGSITVPTAVKDLIFNGEEQPLINAGYSADGTVMYYHNTECYTIYVLLSISTIG